MLNERDELNIVEIYEEEWEIFFMDYNSVGTSLTPTLESKKE